MNTTETTRISLDNNVTELTGKCGNLSSTDNASMIGMAWKNHSLTIVFMRSKDGSWYFHEIGVEVMTSANQLSKKYLFIFVCVSNKHDNYNVYRN